MSLESLNGIAAALVDLRTTGGSVFLHPHVGADGDALGSSLGLSLALERIGIRATVLLEEPPMSPFGSLPGTARAVVCGAGAECGPLGAKDAAIAIDCEGPGRIGSRAPSFQSAPYRVVLDHHPPEPLQEVSEDGTILAVDPTLSSCGEIVFRLVLEMERATGTDACGPDVATCLLAALMSDTGGFRYSNTNAASLRCAADLVERGAGIQELTRLLFDAVSHGRLRLMGRAFTEARFHCGGKVAALSVDAGMLASCGAREDDLDGIAGRLRDVEGVEVAFVLRERPDGTVRVNVRSNADFDSTAFARSFGGGGHRRASGFTLRASLPEAVATVLAEAARILG